MNQFITEYGNLKIHSNSKLNQLYPLTSLASGDTI